MAVSGFFLKHSHRMSANKSLKSRRSQEAGNFSSLPEASAGRYAAILSLAVPALIFLAHVVIIFKKENYLRNFRPSSYLEELINAFIYAVADKFWAALLSGICMFLATFMTVYCNSTIPGVEPPLPWDSAKGGIVTVSYAMCPLVGLLTFVWNFMPYIVT